MCSDMNTAHIAVLLGKWGLEEQMYRVERNEGIINKIIERGEEFWKAHVETKTPPPNVMPGDVDLLKRIHREPGTWAMGIDEILLSNWNTNRDVRLQAEKDEKLALAELLSMLGAAEGAKFASGVFSYLEQNGADSLDRSLLKSKYPEIYEEVAKPVRFRVARFKKNK
jgi:hypothetical protein